MTKSAQCTRFIPADKRDLILNGDRARGYLTEHKTRLKERELSEAQELIKKLKPQKNTLLAKAKRRLTRLTSRLSQVPPRDLRSLRKAESTRREIKAWQEQGSPISIQEIEIDQLQRGLILNSLKEGQDLIAGVGGKTRSLHQYIALRGGGLSEKSDATKLAQPIPTDYNGPDPAQLAAFKGHTALAVHYLDETKQYPDKRHPIYIAFKQGKLETALELTNHLQQKLNPGVQMPKLSIPTSYIRTYSKELNLNPWQQYIIPNLAFDLISLLHELKDPEQQNAIKVWLEENAFITGTYRWTLVHSDGYRQEMVDDISFIPEELLAKINEAGKNAKDFLLPFKKFEERQY